MDAPTLELCEHIAYPIPHHDDKRIMGPIQLAVWVYLCVNAGPYGVEAAVAGTPPLVLLVFLISVPFLWCLPIALVSSELSSTFHDSSGGLLVWAFHAFGDDTCAVVSLIYMITNFCDNCMYPLLAANYIASLLGVDSELYLVLLRLAVVCVAVLVNGYGLEVAGRTAGALVVLFLAPMMVLSILALPYVDMTDWVEYSPSELAGESSMSLFGLVLWMLSGFEDLGNMVESVRNPQRTYVLAMTLSIILMMVFMVIPVFFSISVQPVRSQWSDSYFADIATIVGGRALNIAVSLGATLGLFSNLLAQLLVSAQALHYTAKHGWVPRVFEYIGKDGHTPLVSLLGCGAVVAVMQLGNLTAVAELWTIFYSMTIVSVLASFLRLRWLYPVDGEGLHRPFKAGSRVAAVFMVVPPFAIVIVNVVLTSTLSKVVTVSFLSVCVLGVLAKRYFASPPQTGELEPLIVH